MVLYLLIMNGVYSKIKYMKFNKSHKRHIAKAITYRFVGSAVTFCIGWIVSGDIVIGFSISGIDFFVKILVYYLHEIVWHTSMFGIEDAGNN